MAILHTDFTDQIIDESNISAIDQRTYSYIRQHGNISYDAVITEETDWQIFYNLTELRKGILSWYDFPRESRVLEIGAGFGTLTGCLCKKCAHVTATERSLYRAQAMALRYVDVQNLDIYAGDVPDMEFPEKFDYIILIGILERMGKGSQEPGPYTEYLLYLQRWLKPGGCLLVAVENRCGARYFCGEPEPHTKRAFDGINHYIRGTSGYSFSRQELADIVQAAGFMQHKFYYPLPDYKLPQMVYTDEYLPQRNLRERLIPYYRGGASLVVLERNLYEDIIANRVFPFFANSFLVECRPREDERGEEPAKTGQILYAAVSTDRGEANSFATVIRADGTVRKSPLYEQGRDNARKLYGNILDLQAHGIPVVEHRLLPGDQLELPFVSWPTLSNYIKEIMRDKQEEFLDLLDRVYGYILQSSEEVDQQANALPSVLGLEEGKGAEEAKKTVYGPILKKAYMELIPLNCFYHAETGKFLYFDQEFVRENYPAKYVLFRAIYYIYCFTPNAEKYYPRKKLLQKYSMEDTWDIYLQEERRFLREIRNQDRYSQFYQWTQVDTKRMLENAKRLEMK